MPKKLTILAACLAALALPSTASAVDVPVEVNITPIPGTDQYAWSCTGHGNPAFVSEFHLWCNGQTATGISPVVKTAGGVTTTPTVCYRVSFRYYTKGILGGFTSWADREDCVSL